MVDYCGYLGLKWSARQRHTPSYPRIEKALASDITYYYFNIGIDYIRSLGASRCFLNNYCKDSFAEVC